MSSESLNSSVSNHAAAMQIMNATTVDRTAIAIRLPLTFLLCLPTSTPGGFIILAFLLLLNVPSGAEGGEGGSPKPNSNLW